MVLPLPPEEHLILLRVAVAEHQMLGAPPKVRVLLGDGLKGSQTPTVKSEERVRFEEGGGRLLKEVPDLAISKIAVEKNKLRVGTLAFSEPVVTMRTSGAGTFMLGTKTYRGDLEIRRRADGTLTLVNHVDLESYTRGVVASAAFSTDGNPPDAVRVCLGGPLSLDDCDRALRLIADTLEHPQHPHATVAG